MKSLTVCRFAPLVAPLVAMLASGAEPAHPLFPPLGDGRGAENALAKFTEEQFLEFVPRQSPRSGQPNPAETKPKAHWTNWKWDPRRPNEIRWGDFVYPSPQFPPKVERVEVLSGKTVEVPYFDTPNGRSYVRGEIDNAKRVQLWRSLRQLAAGYTAKHDERFARRFCFTSDGIEKPSPSSRGSSCSCSMPGVSGTCQTSRPARALADSGMLGGGRRSLSRLSRGRFLPPAVDDILLSLDALFSAASTRRQALPGETAGETAEKTCVWRVSEWLAATLEMPCRICVIAPANCR